MAEPIFNNYRRDGHQFDVKVYNSILEGWAAQVSKLCTGQ